MGCVSLAAFCLLFDASSKIATSYDQPHLEPKPSVRHRHKNLRNRHNRTQLKKTFSDLSYQERVWEFSSSVDYYACCGLGHRLGKQTDAAYTAYKLGFGLRVYWGFCGDNIEVFSYLFGPEPAPVHVTSQHRVLKITNEAPLTWGLNRKSYWDRNSSVHKRQGYTVSCPCEGHREKIDMDVRVYKDLQQRYRRRKDVQDFVRQHKFVDHTVIGIHIRAGNGESGDFESKNRAIRNTTEWIRLVHGRLNHYLHHKAFAKPPLVYVATDTQSILEGLKSSSSNKLGERRIPIVDWSQRRAQVGVFFGEKGANITATGQGLACLEGWEDALTDMMILSEANVVVAARPSSFVQSMPHALVLSKENTKDDPHEYCEIDMSAHNMWCYDNYMDWCCLGNTHKVHRSASVAKYEYVRVPKPWNETEVARRLIGRKRREIVLPVEGGMSRKTFLPYTWNNTHS